MDSKRVLFRGSKWWTVVQVLQLSSQLPLDACAAWLWLKANKVWQSPFGRWRRFPDWLMFFIVFLFGRQNTGVHKGLRPLSKRLWWWVSNGHPGLGPKKNKFYQCFKGRSVGFDFFQSELLNGLFVLRSGKLDTVLLFHGIESFWVT